MIRGRGSRRHRRGLEVGELTLPIGAGDVRLQLLVMSYLGQAAAHTDEVVVEVTGGSKRACQRLAYAGEANVEMDSVTANDENRRRAAVA